MKNALMVYKGGGDSSIGCIWEWNACMWNEFRQWSSIIATGRFGCNTQQEAMNHLLEYNPNIGLTKPWLMNSTFDMDLLDIKNEEHMTYFANSYNVGLAYKILEFFDNNDINHVLTLKCGKCNKYVKHSEDISLEGLEWCGGIAMQYTKLICNDCRSIGTCDLCGEYYDDENDLVMDARTEERICEHCIYRKIDDFRNYGTEDIKKWNVTRLEILLNDAINFRKAIENYNGLLDKFDEQKMANCI